MNRSRTEISSYQADRAPLGEEGHHKIQSFSLWAKGKIKSLWHTWRQTRMDATQRMPSSGFHAVRPFPNIPSKQNSWGGFTLIISFNSLSEHQQLWSGWVAPQNLSESVRVCLFCFDGSSFCSCSQALRGTRLFRTYMTSVHVNKRVKHTRAHAHRRLTVTSRLSASNKSHHLQE